VEEISNTTTQTTMSNTLVPAGEFKYRGRKYTLYKRGDKQTFQFRYNKNGKDTWKSLATPIKAAAIEKAISYLTAAQNENWEVVEAMSKRNNYCTIGDILDVFNRQKGGMPISRAARQDYASQFIRFLRIATGKQNVRELRSNILTADLVHEFVKECRLLGRSENGIRASLIQARAVFKESRMHIYKELKLPDLQGFRVRPDIKIALDESFTDFTPAEVEGLTSAAAGLWTKRDPIWVVYILMSELGLRNIEAKNARWEDVVIRTTFDLEGRPVHNRTLRVKANYAEAVARFPEISDELWAELMVYKQEDSAYLVPGTSAERTKICDRHICRFVEPYIKGRRKLAYELRRWAGSRVATRYGIFAAQAFLGHRSVTTTETYYAKNLSRQMSASRLDHAQLYGIQTQGTLLQGTSALNNAGSIN
jgi:integrase